MKQNNLCESRFCWFPDRGFAGVITGRSPGAHRALPGYSLGTHGGTHRVLTGYSLGYSLGTHRVLTGVLTRYSLGTHWVLTGRSLGSLGCRGLTLGHLRPRLWCLIRHLQRVLLVFCLCDIFGTPEPLESSSRLDESSILESAQC
jgi:hypothetical protein